MLANVPKRKKGGLSWFAYNLCVTFPPPLFRLSRLILGFGLTVLLFTSCSSDPDDEVLVVPSSAPEPVVTIAPVTQPPAPPERADLFATAAPAATAECPVGGLDNNSSVSTVGLDEVLFGMTVNQAQSAAGICLVPENEVARDCYYVRPVGGPDGVGFMVTNGTIERVDIISGTLTTRSGAGLRSTEQQILDLFPGKIETTTGAFGGNQLAFIPSDADDQQFRVIWETNADGNVVSFRSGRLPQVSSASGCA